MTHNVVNSILYYVGKIKYYFTNQCPMALLVTALLRTNQCLIALRATTSRQNK